MIYLNKNTPLTTDLLHKLINHYQLNTLPQLIKWDNYYKGKHKILNKTYGDQSKACNHIVTNFCKIIADTYSGYICGKPISYTSADDIEDVQKCLNYNDSAAADMAFITNALTYGVAYELQWLDKYAQVRYTQISPLSAFAVFDNSLDCELLYFVRWYKADAIGDSDVHYFEVYDAQTKTIYKAHGLGGNLEFVEQQAHYFGDVPISVFYLNNEEESIFNNIISLNDAYNELQSAEIDDFSAWVDAYLMLIGVDADAEDIAAMKANRVMVLPENAQAAWLTKNANDTQIVNILDNLKKNIFKVTACPDMADEAFLAQSGTALAYKLVGFENVAATIVARFTRAIQRRIELICNVLNLKAADAVWRDISIEFVRNLPVNITDTVQLVNSLHGLVSDKTLLAQLPFVDNIEQELELLAQQKQSNMDLFSFSAPDEDSEGEGV